MLEHFVDYSGAFRGFVALLIGSPARYGQDFWRICGEDEQDMDARWAKLAASCAQDGP